MKSYKKGNNHLLKRERKRRNGNTCFPYLVKRFECFHSFIFNIVFWLFGCYMKSIWYLEFDVLTNNITTKESTYSNNYWFLIYQIEFSSTVIGITFYIHDYWFSRCSILQIYIYIYIFYSFLSIYIIIDYWFCVPGLESNSSYSC